MARGCGQPSGFALQIMETAMRPEDRGHQKNRIKVLFVCFADSPHSQSWMNLLRDSEFDVRVFASSVSVSEMFPPQPWRYPTYTLYQPGVRNVPTGKVRWLLPKSYRLRNLTNWTQERFYLISRWLRWAISNWKPDIVHTLRLNPEAGLSLDALRKISEASRPKWLLSSWGQELSIDIENSYVRKQVVAALELCDGFIADCERDVRKAQSLGLAPAKIGFRRQPPGNGGLDLTLFGAPQAEAKKRSAIVVPKAYESINHKALSTLEALQLAQNELGAYKIHLLMCSNDVQMWLRRTPESFQQLCEVHRTLPEPEFISLLKRARTVIGTSLSDGSPISMLDAMAAGALPLMSPLDSIQEWIEDGSNGLLAPALQPDRIASALRRSLTDDELWMRARDLNWRIVSERADRVTIREQVLDYYRSVIA